MRLKVWTCGLGVEDRLVATTSQRLAAEAFGMSLYEFRQYASETANEADRTLALAHPGTFFRRSNRQYGQPWVAVVVPRLDLSAPSGADSGGSERQ